MNLKVNKKNISILYSFLLPWLPFLAIYKSGIPGINIAEVILLVLFIVFLILQGFGGIKTKPFEMFFLGFYVFCLFTTIISFFFNDQFLLHWLNRVIRFTFYGFCVVFLSKSLFDEERFIKSSNIFSVILFLGIILQYLVYYGTGVYIRLYKYFLPVSSESLDQIDYQKIFTYSVFRPSSLFTEPSHVAQFLIVVFIINLWNYQKNKDKKILFISCISFITIALTKSLWGYLLLAVVVFVFLIINIHKKHSGNWFVILPIVIILVTLILIRSGLIEQTFSRIELSNINNSSAFTGRFGGYDNLKGLKIFELIFGSGFGVSINFERYSNSIALLLIGEGFIGLFLYLVLLIKTFSNIKTSRNRVILIVYFILLFGSTIVFSINMIILFSILFYSDNDENSICKERNNEILGVTK